MTPASAHSQCFGAIVVGSGFGGAVTACRLAEAGVKVLVLERGKPYPPGSFPRTPRGMRENFWDPAAGLHGLFDVWSFSNVTALVASGLGGGSLIYANVMLRKPEETFGGEMARATCTRGRSTAPPSSRTTTAWPRSCSPSPTRPNTSRTRPPPRQWRSSRPPRPAASRPSIRRWRLSSAPGRGRRNPECRCRTTTTCTSARGTAADCSGNATWAATRAPRTRSTSTT